MSYEKQTWTTGDIITAEKLNHMENGIENGSDIFLVNFNMSGGEYSADKTYEELYNAALNGKCIIGCAQSAVYNCLGIRYVGGKVFIGFSCINTEINNYDNIYGVSISTFQYYSNGEIVSSYRQIYSEN